MAYEDLEKLLNEDSSQLLSESGRQPVDWDEGRGGRVPQAQPISHSTCPSIYHVFLLCLPLNICTNKPIYFVFSSANLVLTFPLK